MKKHWWKALGVIILVYTFAYGLLVEVPDLNTLHEAIRNLFYHVPVWFAMITLVTISVVCSVLHLSSSNKVHNNVDDHKLSKAEKYDLMSKASISVGVLFGLLGYATGTLWGNYSWGNASSWITRDPRSLSAIIALLFYLAYFVLRGSIDNYEKKARISNVYSIFAYVMYILFILIVPRISEGLHPGVGGNPAFSVYDGDNDLKFVFYPAVIGYILLSVWIMNLKYRSDKVLWLNEAH